MFKCYTMFKRKTTTDDRTISCVLRCFVWNQIQILRHMWTFQLMGRCASGGSGALTRGDAFSQILRCRQPDASMAKNGVCVERLDTFQQWRWEESGKWKFVCRRERQRSRKKPYRVQTLTKITHIRCDGSGWRPINLHLTNRYLKQHKNIVFAPEKYWIRRRRRAAGGVRWHALTWMGMEAVPNSLPQMVPGILVSSQVGETDI